MTTKIRTEDNCYSGRDYVEFCQAQGANTEKIGSYVKVTTEKGEAYIPDCNRHMPKGSRKTIVEWLQLIGIGAPLIALMIWALVSAL